MIEVLFSILLGVLGAYCASAGFAGFFDIPYSPAILLTSIILLTAVLRLAREYLPKIAFLLRICTVLTAAIVLLRHTEAVSVGLRAVVRALKASDEGTAFRWLNYSSSIAGTWHEPDCVRLLADAAAVAVVVLLDYADHLLKKYRMGILCFLLRFAATFPLLECGLYVGLETASWAVFGLTVFWIAALVQAGIAGTEERRRRADRQVRYSARTAGALTAMLLASVTAAGVLLGTAGYSRSTEMRQLRSQMIRRMHNFSLRDVTGMLGNWQSKHGLNITGDTLDISSADRLDFTGETALTATVGGGRISNVYYLRGRVRSEYTGKGWGLPTSAYWANSGLFREMTAQGHPPQTMFLSDHIDEIRMPNGKIPAVRCSITAMGEESVNYLPYESICGEDARYRYDTDIELGSTKEYAFWLVRSAVPDWRVLSSDSAPSEDSLVQEYEAFVRNNYLRVPDTAAIRRVREQVEPILPPESASLIEKLTTIRSYLASLCTYTTEPGKMPEGSDVVEYFLTESHKGFCVHFASSAVLMCRMSGIPARYCQGYVLVPSNAVEQTDEITEYAIPDSQAHAWAEVYVQGYGWMPYEFTKGMLSEWSVNEPPAVTSEPPVTEPAQTTATVPEGTLTTISAAQTTVAVTSASQSSAAVTTSSAAGAGGNGSGALAVLRVLATVVLIGIVFVGLLWLWAIWHRRTVAARRHAMRGKDPNAAANASYRFLMQLLKMQGITPGRQSHEEFALYAEEKCPLLKAGAMQNAVAVEQAVLFGNTVIPAQDAAMLCETAEQLAEALCQESGTLRRFVLRYIRHIVT